MSRLLLRVTDQLGAITLLLGQLVVWQRVAATNTAAPAQHANQLALVSLVVAYLLLALLLPHTTWAQHRVKLIGFARVMFALVPSWRSAKDGTALLLLYQPASPGWRGWVLDWFRLNLGTRLLPIALMGVLMDQPPLAVLLQQAALTALTANGAGFCATPLLADPLSRERLERVWHAVELVPTMVPSLGPWLTDSEARQHELRCVAVLSMQQCILGVAVPTLIVGSAFKWPWSYTTHRQRRRQPEAPEEGQEWDAARWQRRGQAAWRRSWGQGAVEGAGAAWDWADEALTDFCAGHGYPAPHVERGIILTLLSGFLWLLCKAWAHHQVMQ